MAYYHHHTVMQQPYYVVPAPQVVYYVPLVPAPYMTRPIFHPQHVQYVDEVAILNSTPNTMRVNQEPMHPFQAFLEESLIRHELGLGAGPARQQLTGSTTSGSGLSKEEISKHLHVYTARCEEDNCCICLGEYEEKEKMGRLDCGHRFHAECIKRWLLSKNVCPMCRSTALTVRC